MCHNFSDYFVGRIRIFSHIYYLKFIYISATLLFILLHEILQQLFSLLLFLLLCISSMLPPHWSSTFKGQLQSKGAQVILARRFMSFHQLLAPPWILFCLWFLCLTPTYSVVCFITLSLETLLSTLNAKSITIQLVCTFNSFKDLKWIREAWLHFTKWNPLTLWCVPRILVYPFLGKMGNNMP